MILNFKNAARCNLHTHTTRSDGDYSVAELCRMYGQEGYKYLAITDHRIYFNQSNIVEGVQVLSGCEFNCYLDLDKRYQFHLLTLKDQKGYGIEHNSSPYNKQFFTEINQVQTLINHLRAKGNLVFIAHPKNPCIPLEILEHLNFDGFEIYNTKAQSDASDYFNNLYSKNNDLLILATDDAHYLQLSDGKGFFQSYIEVCEDQEFYNSLKGKAYYASKGLIIQSINLEERSLDLKLETASTIKLILQSDHEFTEVIFDKVKQVTYDFNESVDAFRIEASKGDEKAWTNFYKVK